MTNKIEKITETQLVEMLIPMTKSEVINIVYRVDESKSRTINKVKALQKEVKINVYLNHDYQQKVQRLTNDDSFQANQMKGKVKISNNVLQSERNGKFMLYATILNDQARETTYFHNGEEISKEKAIEMDLFTPSFFQPKATMGRGSVSEDDDFSLISPYISNILSVTIRKQKYEIIH